MLVKRILERAVERDIRNKARATKTFRVVADHVLQTELGILNHPVIPNIGTPYELSLSAAGVLVCVRQRVTKLSPLLWEVEVEYDTHIPPESPREPNRPLLQPPRLTWGGSHQLEYKRKDLNGKEFVDAAGTPMVDLPPQEIPLLILYYERNEPFFDAAVFFDYVKTVNKGAFGVFAAKTCKMENITGTPADWEGQTYYKVLYEIHIRPTPWIPLEILNQGPSCWKQFLVGGIEVETRKVPVIDRLGNRAGRFMPLAADGFQLDDGVDLVYLEFQVLKEADWAQILF